MDTIDFAQLMLNLRDNLTPKEIAERAGLTEQKIRNIQEVFEGIQAFLDLHLDVCPEHHNKEMLLIKK